MTVIVAGRGSDFNFLVADAIALEARGSATGTGDFHWAEKIVEVTDQEEYAAVTGHEIVAIALGHLAGWVKYKKRRIGLLDHAGVNILAEAATRVRRACLTQHPDLCELSRRSTIYVCTATHLKKWQIHFDESDQKYIVSDHVPVALPIGRMEINYAGDVSYVDLRSPAADILDFAIEEINRLHESKKITPGVYVLPYDFGGRFSRLLLHGAGSDPFFKMPYDTFSDYVAGSVFGSKENIQLIGDPHFDWDPF